MTTPALDSSAQISAEERAREQWERDFGPKPPPDPHQIQLQRVEALLRRRRLERDRAHLTATQREADRKASLHESQDDPMERALARMYRAASQGLLKQLAKLPPAELVDLARTLERCQYRPFISAPGRGGDGSPPTDARMRVRLLEAAPCAPNDLESFRAATS